MTRSIKALAALAMAGASILCTTSQASADPNPNHTGSAPQWVQLRTSHYVGVYTSPDAGSGKYNNITLAPNSDWVWADCWVAGGYVGSDGNVWYRTEAVWQYGQSVGVGVTWTFGPYVDGAAKFHDVPGLPHC
ncbi:hypothetical protein EH183_42135 [Streptomyces sp. CB01881]|uniref:hypothetical protein n=1 Tax=Streptomyces sp. CB01881 TaxID=2078691 RepID=UPI0011E0570F|nr:hypothetical protein [Streptomyces sp. CB01881]TYC66590.1 hypothetical protein EH183_42135 [Streptomyces sp. CB01881]